MICFSVLGKERVLLSKSKVMNFDEISRSDAFDDNAFISNAREEFRRAEYSEQRFDCQVLWAPKKGFNVILR